MSDSWYDIDFPCEGAALGPSNEGYSERVSPIKTADTVRAMAMDHFPEGPAAAATSQTAYLDWRKANARGVDGTVFFNTGEHPKITPDGRRWRAFITSWEDRCAAAQSNGRVYAKVDLGNTLDLSRQLAQLTERRQPRETACPLDRVKLMEQTKSGSWRARRPPNKPAPGPDKGKVRGRSG